MNNRELFRLAWARARGIARWMGAKLLTRFVLAFGAMAAVLTFVAMGWIPAALLKDALMGIGALLGVLG